MRISPVVRIYVNLATTHTQKKQYLNNETIEQIKQSMWPV